MREPMRGRMANGHKEERLDRRMFSWEMPERLSDKALKRRLCGSRCEKCEVLCGFGKEWLARTAGKGTGNGLTVEHIPGQPGRPRTEKRKQPAF